ncbi:enoyl-CoA hydratase/isomerase family protein [Nocardioides massiliensis]|uniref:Enoyl-CoA hydratase/carnithine racemase n=1 Tax=Nocardioides massiliensis TaxID=1325935 RepID=A0ABT9NKP6_9ACTN|nr:enoyl-CoA hydratase-related protein [Nocardioides massiliensis]MDP9820787.1 enoyl-CoA hydratase/carnithine racemase [Nocardioides massiliensis]
MSDLAYATGDRIATITLNRPDKKNAFTLDMVDAWAAALREAARDDSVRAVVVAGAGDSFCAGVDLAALAEVDDTPMGRKSMLTDRVHQVAIALADLDKPVIAAMRGAAVGAGLDMALLCDMRVAGRSIRLIEGYIKVGLVPGDGGAWLLPRLVGTAKAMELLMTGDAVGAEEALRLGLVNHVYADETVLDEAMALAGRIAAAPPIQISMIKRLVRSAESIDLRTHYDMVSSHFGIVSALEDYAEAQRSFSERQPGNFRGR